MARLLRLEEADIVLPDGTLFGEGVKTRIKQELLEKCNLHTIVRLPNGVFAPYTGIVFTRWFNLMAGMRPARTFSFKSRGLRASQAAHSSKVRISSRLSATFLSPSRGRA